MRLRPSRIAIAVFIAAGLAMFLNEARLERNRPRSPDTGHAQRITFKDGGRLTAMFITREDEGLRLGITAIALSALGAYAWFQKRGR